MRQTPILVPAALSTSSLYTFRGYHPGYLESFLLRPIYNTIIAPNNAKRMKGYHASLPSPAVVDRAIDRMGSPYSQFASSSRSSSPTKPSSPTKLLSPAKAGQLQQSMSKLSLESQRDGPAFVQQDVAGDRGKKRVMKAPSQLTVSTPHLARLDTAFQQATLYGSPSASPLFNSHSRSSVSSVSSVSTTDYWVGEDESIFQGADDPSVVPIPPSGSSVKGKGCVALPSTSTALVPFISVGPNTAAAIISSGLSDSVHKYLHNLIATKVTAAWKSDMQAPPLSLSATTAETLYRAVLHDM